MSSSEDASKIQADAQQSDEWIVQAKTRRLVPQHSLSRQDLEADKNKTVAPVDATKKKVIRFTKEEMMTFRQPAKILSGMSEMLEVISLERLNPVCFERFEPEDVIRIWNLDKNGPGKGGVDAAGRGRGRGKTFKAGEEQQSSGDHVPGDWSTAPRQTQSKGGLWDDAGASAGADGLDLSDFAAMALKFRSEMEQMKLSGEADGELGGGEEDMMDRLLREQNDRTGGGGIEDEEDDVPDWATEEVAPVAPQPAAKRNLLLETLKVAPAPVVAPVVTPAPAPMQQQVNYNNASSMLAPPPLLRVEPSEWLYTDPQGNVQGPFEQDNMRQWHEAGYFNAELPIKLRHWSGFHTFATVFPDFKRAFLNVPSEPGSSLLLSLQQQQQQQQQLLQQQQAEELARQQNLEQERQERAQQEAQRAHALRLQQQEQEEAHRRQQAILQQQQQQQLAQHQQQLAQQQLEQQRQLLEQERQQQAAAAAAATAAAQKPVSVAPWANKQPGPNRSSATSAQESLLAIQSEEKARAEEDKKRQVAEAAKITKGWNGAAGASAPSLAEIQQEEEARQRQSQAEANRVQAAAPATTNMSFQLKNILGVKAAPAPAAASSGPAWGSTAAPASAAKGSLRDIMQEEEGSEGASPVKGGPSASSNAPRKPLSWAAKAGSSGYSTAPAAAAAPVRIAPRPVVVPAPAPVTVAPVVVKKAVVANKEKSDFGGKEMSKDMADWCAAQLKRLNGSDDITLMQFCMSLESAVEVREYLSEYLGSSPSVTNFATDFIKYKEGGRRAVADSSVGQSASGAGSASNNNNNNNNFVSANKKKGKAPPGK